MEGYIEYLDEIETRKSQGLSPKPIDSGDLLLEIIEQIKDVNHESRKDSIHFFCYNVLPGTTSAAARKAHFLKQIILGQVIVDEIQTPFAFELLSHMKGGPSIEVLIDITLGMDSLVATEAAEVLKKQVFLYEADTSRLEEALKANHPLARKVLESYAKAEFFTKLPDLPEEIEVVTFVAGVGDISTDLLSPGSDAHSRSDRELHGQCMFEHNEQQQEALRDLQAKHPDKRIMLLAEKGTMGVGSSRMSGVNNVALWIGKEASPFIPFINIAPIVAGTNGISPIFLTTVGVTGGIGIDLKNWRKKTDAAGNVVFDDNEEPVLEKVYSVDTGTVLTINTKSKKLFNGDEELMDISSALLHKKLSYESRRFLCHRFWKETSGIRSKCAQKRPFSCFCCLERSFG
jgi:aconitate hydratase 2/2-methylisocitrate dehydratase